MRRNRNTDLVKFFYEVGSLKFLKRSYGQHMLQEAGSVAEHLQRVTIIAYLLAKEMNLDSEKAIVMAAFHDLPEARIGDTNWHQKEYVAQDENKAWEVQLALMGKGASDIREILSEYKERKTPVSQLVKDSDNIEYVLSLKELALQGNEEAKRRLREDVDLGHIYTEIGKKMIRSVVNSKPNVWYQQDRQKTHKKYLVKRY